jgi:hypothetical protein
MTTTRVTFDEELTRVVDRLRSMPLSTLGRPVGPDDLATRAMLVRDLAQWMADATAAREGWPHRAIPDVGDLAVGDQLAVTGADLRAAALEYDETLLLEASERLRTLRLTL